MRGLEQEGTGGAGGVGGLREVSKMVSLPLYNEPMRWGYAWHYLLVEVPLVHTTRDTNTTLVWIRSYYLPISALLALSSKQTNDTFRFSTLPSLCI